MHRIIAEIPVYYYYIIQAWMVGNKIVTFFVKKMVQSQELFRHLIMFAAALLFSPSLYYSLKVV